MNEPPSPGAAHIAFGFPTTGAPLVIDVSTAAFPGSELDFYRLLGLPLPSGRRNPTNSCQADSFQ